jgi:hypothetical protein
MAEVDLGEAGLTVHSRRMLPLAACPNSCNGGLGECLQRPMEWDGEPECQCYAGWKARLPNRDQVSCSAWQTI